MTNDITRCSNADCHLRHTCRRYYVPTRGESPYNNHYSQAHFEPDADGKCEYYKPTALLGVEKVDTRKRIEI